VPLSEEAHPCSGAWEKHIISFPLDAQRMSAWEASQTEADTVTWRAKAAQRLAGEGETRLGGD
jgi:tRNA splicing ligase